MLIVIIAILAAVFLLPPVIALISSVYYYFRLRAKQEARWRRVILPIEGEKTRRMWDREHYQLERRRAVMTRDVLKAWGFIIAINFVWNGFNGMFMALFQMEESLFPVFVSAGGFVASVILAAIWWTIEWRDPIA